MSDHQVVSVNTLVTLGEFGERARALRAPVDEAALIIGLGYVGLRAVALTHEMLARMLPARAIQNQVQLCAIYRRRSYKEEEIIPREERLSLEMDPVGWDDVPGRYSARGVAQWWPPPPRVPEIREDPWSVRAYNRLLLFHNAELVSGKLFTLARWLQNVGTGRALQVKRRIYVLASLAEAEGSGMLFDVVARLRDLVSQSPATIIGLFSLRDRTSAQSNRGIAMANVYATLCEIDSYTLHPDSFPSTLPVLGHSLTRAIGKPALDMILLTDDADADALDLPNPEDILAEAVTSWIAASLCEPDQAPEMPKPIPVEPGTDRFRGYSVFGVSKLALPTRTAMHWAAVRLGHSALKAMMITHPNVPTTPWVETALAEARSAVLTQDVIHAPDVFERWHGWEFDLSSAGLIRNLEARAARGDSDRMRDLAQAERLRLEREFGGESTLGQSTISAASDSLRLRMDQTLSAMMQPVVHRLSAGAVDLAYGQGLGLIWTVSAFGELETRVRALLPDLQDHLNTRKLAYKAAGDAFIKSAQEYDEKTGGRRGRKPPPTDLDERASALLQAALGLMEMQAKLALWQELCGRVGDLGNQLRAAIAEVDRTAQALEEYRVAAGDALRIASEQPEPRFPAAVVVNRQWFLAGTQNLDAITQIAPHELLSRMFKAWGRPDQTAPERQLVEFLRDIRTAARHALAGVFQFPDISQFLAQNWDAPAVSKAVAQLPDAAMPALEPVVDEDHPPPTWYEVVRQVPRPLSALGAVLNGIVRAQVPSPDPDEIVTMRILHGIMAEALPKVRDMYRRAYQRVEAEGMPLHIDRRWDRTMADLVHTTTRHEISLIWENVLGTLRGHPQEVDRPLRELIRALGMALDVTGVTVMPNLPPDMRLVVYKLPLFQLKLPPPTCAVLFLFSTRAATKLSEEIVHAVTSLALQEPFAFVVNVNNRADINEIIAPLQGGSYNVLVLSEADVKRVIGARQPTRALNDLVISRVKLVTVSPFYTRDPVPEHMFFGRDKEIADVRSLLRTHSVALIGGRRIGKTSTLFRIRHHLAAPHSEAVPCYLDCHGVVRYYDFFYRIGKRWKVSIAKNANPVQFEDVVDQVQAKHPDKKLVFLFDEVDSLLRFDRQPENGEVLFRTFRSLSHDKRCQFVFSGERWLLRALEDPDSGLFNFPKPVQLKPLPREVVRELVAKPFQMLNIWMEDPAQTVQRIYDISAGHPNVVQLICEGMIIVLDQDTSSANLLKVDHLRKSLEQRELQEEIVRTIWGQMNPLAKLVTLRWPDGEEFITLDEMEGVLHDVGIARVPLEQLQWTARDLEIHCFLRPVKKDRWKLLPVQFAGLLNEVMPERDRLIDDLRDEYANDPDSVIPSS